MSGLLPTLPSEFNKSSYWESFFKKRTRAFEWYGTYYELCGILHRYIKPADHVLMAGCGNSELSENMYDAGLKNIINIDISQTVIDQMLRRRGDRQTLEYLKMDLTSLEFEEDHFSVIVDKGTLDAIMSDDSEKSHETTDKIFSEYSRVLKNGGRYICITLAQDFILKKIMSYFPGNGWLVRLHRVAMSSDNESNDLPVFAFVLTKFKNLPKKILEICSDESPLRVENEQRIVDFVKSQQYYIVLKSSLRSEVQPGKENPPIELFTTTNSNHPRFVMRIVDNNSFKLHCMFAVFIVPQGRENEWMFATHEGRMKVAEQTPFKRVLFVSLNPDHEYGSRENLHNELNSTVMDFGPPGIKEGDNVPYLSTTAEDIGKRIVRFKGESAITGPYLVEDYIRDGDVWYRHLLFGQRENVIQCEIRLKENSSPAGGKKSNRRKKPSEDTEVVRFPDPTYLASQYAEAVVAGLILRYKPEDRFKLMVIGVGGGTLTSFILHNFKKCSVTAVEIDGALIEIGNTWFGLPKPEEEPRLNIGIADGVKFVYDEQKTVKGEYDAIFIDVDVKDPSLGISCPPAEFLEEEYLRAAIDLLAADGLFMVNLLCRSEEMRAKVMYNLRKLFAVVGSFRCELYYNEVVYCFKQKPKCGAEKNTKGSKKKKKKRKQGKDMKNDSLKEGENDSFKDAKNDSFESPNLEDAERGSKSEVENIEGLKLSPSSRARRSPDSKNEVIAKDGTVSTQSAVHALNGDFKPPPVKRPLNLENYDVNLFKLWVEKSTFWESYWTESMGSCSIELSNIVPNIMMEQAVDYHTT